MGFTLRYEILFEVQIPHLYYFHSDKGIFDFDKLTDAEKDLYYKDLGGFDLQKSIEVIPDSETEKLLTKNHLVFKDTPLGFFVGAKVEVAEGNKLKPFGGLGNKLKLSFRLKAASPYFSNITGLRFNELNRGIFYFSNTIGASGGEYPYLPAPTPKFKSGDSYFAGDLVYSTSSSRLYEALEDNNDKLTSGKWLRLTQPVDGKRFYAGFSDHINHLPGLLIYRFPLSNMVDATFQLIDFESNALVDERGFSGLTAPVNSFQLDYRNFKKGKYKLKVSGTDSYKDELVGYLDVAGEYRESFGILEMIFEKGKDLGDYNLLDPATETVRTPYPVFSLPLKNRSTYWLYTFNREQDVADLGAFEKFDDSNKRFVTKDIKTLSKFTQDVKKFNTDQLLPNPGIEIVKPLKPKIYSEIFL